MRFYEEIASIREQVKSGSSFELPDSYRNIVICGMGGSAIAGLIFQDLFSKVPVTVANGYWIPDYVDENTLFIAVSHSGNTEETLYGIDRARERNAQIRILTSGGKLSDFNEKKIMIPGTFQPRSSIGYMLMPFLNTFGLMSEKTLEKLEDALTIIFNHENTIKAVAENLVKSRKIPLIFGLPPSPTIAYRWKTQFNENSKMIAHSAILPEMNHNEIAAIPHDLDPGRFEFFVAGTAKGRNLDRLRISQEISGFEFHGIPEIDYGTIPEIFASIVYGDLLTYYAAVARDIDPRDVSAITELKKKLSS